MTTQCFMDLFFPFIFLEGFSVIFANSKAQPVITVLSEDVSNNPQFEFYYTVYCSQLARRGRCGSISSPQAWLLQGADWVCSRYKKKKKHCYLVLIKFQILLFYGVMARISMLWRLAKQCKILHLWMYFEISGTSWTNTKHCRECVCRKLAHYLFCLRAAFSTIKDVISLLVSFSEIALHLSV